ncbi:hypothetical protein ASZ78_012665 [Callipepla squamata]|uniref:Uncharacterized protein n=1 Tax=Callipepla squamata TaxID=9009 RepID=A0A226MR17_CALSU|nr:hypothetical protein ASZ78_012665 [Callipepla squamata]
MEEKKVKPEEQNAEESVFQEALLEFLIEKKEAAIDKVLFDLKQVEKKNKEYHEKNDSLKEEQQAHIRRILRRMKEKEQEKDAKEVVTRDDVEEALRDKWQYAKDKEQILKEYYRNALKAVKEENDTLVEMHMKKAKEQAPESAVRRLDKHSRRKIEENERLKEEIKRYRKEVRDLEASVWLLQEENINLVRKLMDNRIQNLGVPRHLFLNRAAGLQDESHHEEIRVEHREYSGKTDGGERSAAVSRRKKKPLPDTQCITEMGKPWDRDEELQEKSLTPILNSLFEVERDFQEYLELGPLESAPMCVVGKAMVIHKEPEEMLSRTPPKGDCSEAGRKTTPQTEALSKEKGSFIGLHHFCIVQWKRRA